MFNKFNLSSLTFEAYKQREIVKKNFEIFSKNMELIKSKRLKEIAYPDFKEAYDYVDSLFPKCNVKEVVIYKVSAEFLEKIGYSGVAGFFNVINKMVVLSGKKYQRNAGTYQRKSINNICAKIEDDEVLVHELCHYCHDKRGRCVTDLEYVEEFAYGNSINYLKSKGYSDDDIIKNNFYPYLATLVKNKAFLNILHSCGKNADYYNSLTAYGKEKFCNKNEKKIYEEIKKLSFEKGRKIIDLYSKDKKHEEKKEINKFSILDI